MLEKYPEDRIFRYQSLINELRSEIEGTIDHEKIEYLSSEIYYLERMIENAHHCNSRKPQ